LLLVLPDFAGSAEAGSIPAQQRPRVAGKQVVVGGTQLYIRGVTYGPFRPDESGELYHTPEAVERDFTLMAANGINALRTYTVPPHWLLDLAQLHGLRVLVGFAWEQHIAFLDDPERIRQIEEQVRTGVRACAGHPAVLGYAVGNEIPASIVRWHGPRRIEQFIERLYRAAKREDPGGLVTYVNYPTTEYLQLPFLDFVCFNVYLETQERLTAYLARLQNLAGDRPLLMAEVGLDSQRNGEIVQAHALEWQVRSAFAAGCGGVFVFAWTDEWHRGGYEIEDWDFGLTTRDRRPKPALSALRKAFAEVPFPRVGPWPRISVVVCTYNGSRTIGECLEGLERLEYPDYEVIVVDDGSTDQTATLVGAYPVRLIRTENRGLSAARNTGMRAATGEIVAYMDDDAYPDPQWLTYLAATFRGTTHAGVGGPNLPPPGDGMIAEGVANAPGGPTHVLLSDTEAEHIPGCNMAFRRICLEAIGGFDPRFRVAGDDVDVCWRLQQQGWTLGFSPAAVVWHHRRNSVRAYWKQQKGYGKAEALLERKWPEKYNSLGHVAWAGRLYGRGRTQPLGSRRGRIYQGTWGSALFQSIYQPAPGVLGSLALMPEWYLVVAGLAVVSALGTYWTPLLVAPTLPALALGVPLATAAASAAGASFSSAPQSRLARYALLALTTLLYLLQPIARLYGRWQAGLTPLRRHGLKRWSDAALPLTRRHTLWSEQWHPPEHWLGSLEAGLQAHGLSVQRGGDFDDWDLEVRGGTLGAIRTRMAIEEHGGGRQLVRFRSWLRWSLPRNAVILLLAALAGGAALDHAWVPAAILGSAALLLAVRKLRECAAAMAAVAHTLQDLKSGGRPARVQLERLAHGVPPARVRAPAPVPRPVWQPELARLAAPRRANGSAHRARPDGASPLRWVSGGGPSPTAEPRTP
jgi:O-antigen biosynthesis protein